MAATGSTTRHREAGGPTGPGHQLGGPAQWRAGGEGGRLYVFDSGRHVEIARASRPVPAGGVVECRFVRGAGAGGGVWEPVMVRTDKTTANDVVTFRKTLLNIREDLRFDEVLAAAAAAAAPR